MLQAYSRLRRVLDKHKMTVAELHRRIRETGLHVTIKSLYRLNDAEQPLGRLDLRLAGASAGPAARRRGMDGVSTAPAGTAPTAAGEAGAPRRPVGKERDGRLEAHEREELRELVGETEALSLENAAPRPDAHSERHDPREYGLAHWRGPSGNALRAAVVRRAREPLRILSCAATDLRLSVPFGSRPSLRARRLRRFGKPCVACASCNLAKTDRVAGPDPVTGTTVALFDPRAQVWEEHFRWHEDRTTLVGLTPAGRATVLVVDANNPFRLEARRLWFLLGLLP